MLLSKPGDFRHLDDFPIRWLKLFGHLPEIKIENLGSAALDPRKGVRAMQRLYGPELAGEEDGWLAGKVVNGMMLDRCSCPDEPDEEIADSDPDKLALLLGEDPKEKKVISDLTVIKETHKSMMASQSWSDCRHNIRVHIDDKRAPSWWDRESIWEWTKARFREVGGNFVETDNKDTSENEIRVSWRNGRSWIGLAEFGSCSQSVFCYFDPGYNGGLNKNRVLSLHEHGHNMGVRHSRGIMGPVINNVEPYWVKRDESGKIIWKDASFSALRNLLGGEPIDEPDPPKPEPGKFCLPLKGHWTPGTGGYINLPDGRVGIVQVVGDELQVQVF